MSKASRSIIVIGWNGAQILLHSNIRAKKNFVSQGTLGTIGQSGRARLNGRAELFRELWHKSACVLKVLMRPMC